MVGADGYNLVHDLEADPDGQALEERIEDYAGTVGRPDILERVRNWRKSAQSITRRFAQAKRRPRAGAAAPVPADRLRRRSSIKRVIRRRLILKAQIRQYRQSPNPQSLSL